jgi:hypothetical protein
MTEDRRHPHRAFDLAPVQRYLRGRTLAAVQRFPAGKSNTNYKWTSAATWSSSLPHAPTTSSARAYAGCMILWGNTTLAEQGNVRLLR